MTDRPLTLMAVHAHPDDEATGTGGVLARYAAEGIRTVLVTCTDGRCGDGPGGVKPGEPGHDPEAVAAVRRTELEAACAVLGVSDLELLDYHDSGMMGWPNNTEPEAFWNTPVDEAAARLAELMRRYQPDVVVTYDENGFYGHPDHIQAHRITMAAVALTGIPEKVYWTTAPRSMMAEFGRVIAELEEESGVSGTAADQAAGQADDQSADQAADRPAGQPETPAETPAETADETSAETPEELEIGLPDEEITTWVDVSEFGAAKYEALAAHKSQTESIFFLNLSVERFTKLMGVETFVRVQDSTDADLPENDLFAGLR